MLTQERLKELLDYDPETGVFTRKVSLSRRVKVGDIAGSLHPHGYLTLMVDAKSYVAHRLAWFYVYGVWPKEIDHINRIRNDNRISNLREVSRLENMYNKSKYANNSSGLTGVSWHKATGKWHSSICAKGLQKYLGLFDTPEEAHAAYLAAKEELHNIGEQQ